MRPALMTLDTLVIGGVPPAVRESREREQLATPMRPLLSCSWRNVCAGEFERMRQCLPEREFAMHLTEREEIMIWPATHYAFVERIGPFAETAQAAWQSLHAQAAALAEHNTITGAMALYKTGTQIYRAGFMLASAAVQLPAGLVYERFAGGRYRRFVLTGPYSDLPEASGRVWQIVAHEHLHLRDDFAIEHYVNDPKVTPSEDLVTEILIPVMEG